MTPAAEARVRQAVADLADALLAALRESEALPAGPDRLLSVDEAARALGLGRSITYGELSSGRLRSLRVGRRRLVPATAIAEFIETNGTAAAFEDSPRRFGKETRRVAGVPPT